MLQSANEMCRIPAVLHGTHLIALLLLLLLPSTESCASGQEYGVEGDMQITYFTNGEPAETRHTKFWVTVSNSKYNLRTLIPGSTNYVEWGSDGHDLYRVVVAPGKYEGALERTPLAPSYPLLIAPSEGVPPDDGSLNQYLWLAYSSQQYFHSLTNNKIEPVWNLDDPSAKPSHVTCEAQIQLDAEGLPLEVVYLNDGVYHGFDDINHIPIKRALPVPYSKGFTNAVYKRLSSKWLNGSSIPEAFRFTLYATPITGQVPLRVRLLLEGRVLRNITERTSAPDLRPSVQGVASVWDSRVTGAVTLSNFTTISYSRIGYFVTNGRWLDTNQVAALRARHEASLVQQYKEEIKAGRRASIVARSVVAIVALVSLVFGLALWKWAGAKHQDKQQSP